MIYIVKGLLYGDEGKGSIVDYLTLGGGEIVKEGGPQAAHHVVNTDGMLHRSEQMGSGIFNKGVKTFCSKNMFVFPQNLIRENLKLNEANVYDGMTRMLIDSRCPVVTPLHQMIGRLTEISRGKNKRGSTGMGVGQAVRDKLANKNTVITMEDVYNSPILEDKLLRLYAEKIELSESIVENNPNNKELLEMYKYYVSFHPKHILNSYNSFTKGYPNIIMYNGDNHLEEIVKSNNNIVFEGSQGALLDPHFGFKPYVSPVKNTFDMSEELISNKVSKSNIKRMGVLRAYSTRHGAGPFVTYDKYLTNLIPDKYNATNTWQGVFKIGWFDLLAVRYGLAVNNADSIAITNLDRLSELNNINVCTSYIYSGKDEEALDKYFEWDTYEQIYRITGIKNPNKPTDNAISKVLLKCEPLSLKRFPGWRTPIHNTKRMENLPNEAINYIKFLQSEDGFNVPISIISVGETSKNKILIQ